MTIVHKMTRLTLLQVLTLSVMLVSTNYLTSAKIGIPPVSVAGSSTGVCPSESTKEDLKSTLKQEIRTQLQNYTQNQEQIGGIQ